MTVLGPEFGTDAGKRAIIVRALYGLKSTSATYRAHLASCARWVIPLAKLTLTYGTKLRPDLPTVFGIMPTYFAMLMTFYVSIMTLCLYSI